MQVAHGNLLTNLPPDGSAEVFELLHERDGLKIERIISTGHASPPGFWYDNPQEEWVLLLSGSAGLTLAGTAEQHVMQAGAWLHIPARCRHRIEWTDTAQPTIWLAVHHAVADGV
ncbi:MAG: cupin domain-containing protein [Collimonas sp.]|uniref:cupin domain-containing protein n=1 Tax=Collimonas sp. TaxID=1963772 RepID=UPI0032645C12